MKIMAEGFRYEKAPNGRPMGMPFCTRSDTIDGILIRIAQTRGKEGYVPHTPPTGLPTKFHPTDRSPFRSSGDRKSPSFVAKNSLA
jgi:hypothetical protein